MLVLEKLSTIHHSMMPVRYYLWKAPYGRIILLAVSVFWSVGAFFHGHVTFFTFLGFKGNWRTSCKMENFPWISSNLLTYCPLVGCPVLLWINHRRVEKKIPFVKKFLISICTESYEIHTYQVVESPHWRNFLAILALNNLKQDYITSNLVLLGGFLFRNFIVLTDHNRLATSWPIVSTTSLTTKIPSQT